MKRYNDKNTNISLWRNNKTRDIYVVEDCDILNATNTDNGTRMVLYYKCDAPEQKYVREHAEFNEKFTYMDGGWCSLKKRFVEDAS